MSRAMLTPLCVLLMANPAAASDAEGPGLFIPFVNLLILAAVLVYFGRKPIVAFFDQRRLQIEDDLQKAAALKADAEKRFTTWQSKLADLQQELDRIRTGSRERAEAERRQILADAEATAERIKKDATAAIEQELRRSRAILHEEAADLAVDLAGDLLRQQVTDADRDRLVSEFIERIERSGAESGR